MSPIRSILLVAVAATCPLAAISPAHPSLGFRAFLLQDPDPPTLADAQQLVNEGRFAEAVAVLEKVIEAEPTNGQANFLHAYSLHAAGNLEAAHLRHIAVARDFPQFAATAHYNHACVHALSGEKEAAFEAIAQAREAGFNSLQQLETDSDMDNLRSDARFAALMLELQPAGTHAGTALTDLANLPANRRLDFMLGEWESETESDGARRHSVSRAFDGNGIQMDVRNLATGEVRSHTTFVHDPESQTWKYVWVNRTGFHAILRGKLEGDRMVFRQADLNGEANDGSRAVLHTVAADSFVYEWQTTEDGGETWTTLATVDYKRR